MLAKEDVPLDTTEPLPSVASKKKKNKKKKSAAAKNAATESLVPLAIDHCGKKFSPFPYPTPCDDVLYVDYTDESWLDDIRVLVAKDLSEPYSIFTYRYFLHNWPKLCVCVFAKTETGERGEMIGTLLCKAEQEYKCYRGYIAMLTVNDTYRGKGIGQKLAMIGIDRMVEMGCEEIVLETEVRDAIVSQTVLFSLNK